MYQSNLLKILNTNDYNNIINSMIKLQLISYIGNGTYGVNHPCSVTMDFEIEYIQILAHVTQDGYVNSVTGTGRFIMISDELTTEFSKDTGLAKNTTYDSFGKISSDKKTISWYSPYSEDFGAQQFNINGIRYYLLCKGY